MLAIGRRVGWSGGANSWRLVFETKLASQSSGVAGVRHLDETVSATPAGTPIRLGRCPLLHQSCVGCAVSAGNGPLARFGGPEAINSTDANNGATGCRWSGSGGPSMTPAALPGPTPESRGCGCDVPQRLRGRRSVAVAPCPSPSLATVTVPPCASTMARVMPSPRPVPPTPRLRDWSVR